LRCWPLWQDQTVAVASPLWLARHGTEPAQWPARERLQLHTEAWPLRLKNQDGRLAPKLPPAQGLAFNDAFLLAQAALMHLGVAWVRRSVVSGALARGELLELAQAQERQGGQTMWLVCRDELAETRPIQTFVDWALLQAIDPLSTHGRSAADPA
jgi:LysR family glycine cleavage system transcriptional activator